MVSPESLVGEDFLLELPTLVPEFMPSDLLVPLDFLISDPLLRRDGDGLSSVNPELSERFLTVFRLIVRSPGSGV